MTDLYQLAFGHTNAQILYAAVSLGVPDALESGPVAPAELARSLGCHPGGLTRLLRALVVLGVAAEVAPGQVTLTELGRPLCASHPRSIRSSVLLSGDPAMWQAWGALSHSVRTGEPAFGHVHGQPIFGYLAGQPGLSALFHEAMSDGTERIAAQLPAAFDVSAARTAVDIGGGSGTLLAAVLAAAPGARGVLLDTAEGAAGAAATARRAGLSGRWTTRVGNFFVAVPEGDLLLLSGILHDWDDTQCGTILRNCRASIAPDGHLLVLEPVRPARLDGARWHGAEAEAVVLGDIAMLVYTGGRERDEAEFADLLAASGFTLSAVTEPLAGTPVRILAATPA